MADASTKIGGLSVEQVAGVHAATKEKIPLADVLAQERIDPAKWPAAEKAWREAIVESPDLAASYAAKVREATRAKIREILTPEQLAKYEELAGREGRGAGAAAAPGGGGNPGRVWILDADGKPKAVALTLGISDGTATEVLRGDLKEGQEIITGLAAAGPNRPGTPGGSAPGGPRLRL